MLLPRSNFKRAVEELTALVKQAYVQHADKTIQELIFEDVLLAIRLCSRYNAACTADSSALFTALGFRITKFRVTLVCCLSAD